MSDSCRVQSHLKHSIGCRRIEQRDWTGANHRIVIKAEYLNSFPSKYIIDILIRDQQRAQSTGMECNG